MVTTKNKKLVGREVPCKLVEIAGSGKAILNDVNSLFNEFIAYIQENYEEETANEILGTIFGNHKIAFHYLNKSSVGEIEEWH